MEAEWSMAQNNLVPRAFPFEIGSKVIEPCYKACLIHVLKTSTCTCSNDFTAEMYINVDCSTDVHTYVEVSYFP